MFTILIFMSLGGIEQSIGTFGGFITEAGCNSFVRVIEEQMKHSNTDLNGKKFRFECKRRG